MSLTLVGGRNRELNFATCRKFSNNLNRRLTCETEEEVMFLIMRSNGDGTETEMGRLVNEDNAFDVCHAMNSRTDKNRFFIRVV